MLLKVNLLMIQNWRHKEQNACLLWSNLIINEMVCNGWENENKEIHSKVQRDTFFWNLINNLNCQFWFCDQSPNISFNKL